jgi:hypothetical protein
MEAMFPNKIPPMPAINEKNIAHGTGKSASKFAGSETIESLPF